MVQGYCMRCRKKVEMNNPVNSPMKNGRKMVKGKCPDCDTTVCCIGAEV